MFKNFNRKPISFMNLKAGINNGVLTVSNNSYSLHENIPDILLTEMKENHLLISVVKKVSSSNEKKAIGTFIANIKSIIKGLNEGHKKTIRFTGTKADVNLDGRVIKMSIGLSHDVVKELPEVVSSKIVSKSSKEILMQLVSPSKQVVGQACSEIVRMDSNVYKGGVHIEDMDKPKTFRERKKGA